MGRNKLLNKASEEDLLKLLEEGASELVIENTTDIVDFLGEFKLEPGNSRIYIPTLYKLYLSWSDIKLGIVDFKLQLSKFLRVTNYYFHVNKNALTFKREIHKFLFKTKQYKLGYRQASKFKAFLKSKEIEGDDQWMSEVCLYHLFDKWTFEQNKSNLMNKISFAVLCKIYLQYKKIEGIYYFRISEKVNKYMSKEQQLEMMQRDKQKKDKKIRQKVSRLSKRFQSKA